VKPIYTVHVDRIKGLYLKKKNNSDVIVCVGFLFLKNKKKRVSFRLLFSEFKKYISKNLFMIYYLDFFWYCGSNYFLKYIFFKKYIKIIFFIFKKLYFNISILK